NKAAYGNSGPGLPSRLSRAQEKAPRPFTSRGADPDASYFLALTILWPSPCPLLGKAGRSSAAGSRACNGIPDLMSQFRQTIDRAGKIGQTLPDLEKRGHGIIPFSGA